MFEISYNKPKEWSPILENAIEAAATSFSGKNVRLVFAENIEILC